MVKLTKSAFLEFLKCKKTLWLQLRDPDAFQWPETTEFDRMLVADGYAVEEAVKAHITTLPDPAAYSFQHVYETEEGLFARADIVYSNEDGTIDIWEIKASTGLTTAGADHVNDAAFQAVVATRAGHTVRRIGIVHVNGDYVLGEVLDTAEFLVFADITEAARERIALIEQTADAALAFIRSDDIDRKGCDCLNKSKGQHCAAFSYFNPGIPDPSIFDIPRLSRSRRNEFLEAGTLGLSAVDASTLTPIQSAVVRAAQSGRPLVNKPAIDRFLEALDYPLYFYDYETFGSAIPIAPGLKPHEQVPVQASLHVLAEDGALRHAECLTESPGAHGEIIDFLTREIGPAGHLISWNASFEASCNDRLARLHPQHTAFLQNLNDRTRDLMEVFKQDYVDPNFGGSTSIKKILPVLVPNLGYNTDSVHDGAGAMEAWRQLVTSKDENIKASLRIALLSYCKLDTLAMVRIHQFLAAL